jgi:hypothetical protein
MRHLRPDDPAKETPFLDAACEDRERAAVPQHGVERQGVSGYAACKGDTVPRRAAGGHEAGGPSLNVAHGKEMSKEAWLMRR